MSIFPFPYHQQKNCSSKSGKKPRVRKVTFSFDASESEDCLFLWQIRLCFETYGSRVWVSSRPETFRCRWHLYSSSVVLNFTPVLVETAGGQNKCAWRKKKIDSITWSHPLTTAFEIMPRTLRAKLQVLKDALVSSLIIFCPTDVPFEPFERLDLAWTFADS